MADWMANVNDEMDDDGTKGALRKQLDVKKGEKIPVKKLAAAAHSKDTKTRRRAVLAETFRKIAVRRKNGTA